MAYKEEDIRHAAKIVSDILLELKRLTKPDVSLLALNEIASRMIKDAGAKSAILGYHPEWAKEPYPATICACVNEEICHAPPGNKVLKEGDIITYDLALKYKTACGDAALTVPVGEISNRKQRLLRYAQDALNVGINGVKADISIAHVSEKIEDFCVKNGFNIIKEYGGHVIGEEMHMMPHIPHHYIKDNEDVTLKEGWVICLEPMLTPGKARIGHMVDGWTTFTLDNQPVAMFEHMILVKKDSYEILTHHI